MSGDYASVVMDKIKESDDGKFRGYEKSKKRVKSTDDKKKTGEWWENIRYRKRWG